MSNATKTTQLVRDIARRDAERTLSELDRRAASGRSRNDAKTLTRESVERRTANLIIALCDDADQLAFLLESTEAAQ